MKALLFAASVGLLAGLSGCAPKISTLLEGTPLTALAPDAQVLVLGVNDVSPAGCPSLGTLRVGDNGLTVNCGFDRMLEEAKGRARKAGANVLKLTYIIEPDMSSTCYRLTAELLVAPDLKVLEASLQRQRQEADKSRLPAGTPYALLYVYRPSAFGAEAVSYDLHLNDSVVYRARYDTRTVIRLSKPGPVILWTKATSPRLTLEVEPGKEYFVRCGVATGGFSPQPVIGFVSTRQGRLEYEQVREQP